MQRVEEEDARDRLDGTPRERRLRAVQPEVGEFLLAIATIADARTIVEIGTSGGYSTLWLALAAQRTGGRVTTFEIDPAKVEIARRNLQEAMLTDWVDSRLEDGRRGLNQWAGEADLVFIDAEKEDYEAFLEPAVRALRRGAPWWPTTSPPMRRIWPASARRRWATPI